MSLHLDRIAELKALKQTQLVSLSISAIYVNAAPLPPYVVQAVSNFLAPQLRGIYTDLQTSEETLAAPELDAEIAAVQAQLAALKAARNKLP